MRLERMTAFDSGLRKPRQRAGAEAAKIMISLLDSHARHMIATLKELTIAGRDEHSVLDMFF
jgi:hypothetical protein